MALIKEIRKMQTSAKRHQDFDPEDEPFGDEAESSGSEDGSADNENNDGRDHYETVGVSRLRRPGRVELDAKRYSSQPISRALLNEDEDEDEDPLAPQEESDEDPFATRHSNADLSENGSSGPEADEAAINRDHNGENADEDEEIDSDEAFESGDEGAFRAQGFTFRGSKTGQGNSMDLDQNGSDVGQDEDRRVEGSSLSEELDAVSDNQSETDAEDAQGDSEDETEDAVRSSNEDQASDVGSADRPAKSNLKLAPSYSAADRELLKNLISTDTATISASLSQAASADAKKGNAVKQQYQAFDRFLDARIKLQKGLTATNDLSVSSFNAGDELQSAAQRAEQAALQLLSTIESVRYGILNVQKGATSIEGKKRKRQDAASSSMSISDLHDRLDDLEAQSVPYRRAVLDKWANKTRAANSSMNSRAKLEAEQTHSNLTSVLDTYLLSSGPKQVQDSQTAISKSTSTNTDNQGQASGTNESSLPPYQDVLFYQSLLRDLIATKSYVNPSSATASSAAMTYNINDRTALPAKIHRQVDRKASKGRKIRYTVHEKLENFMASTGRQSVGDQWTESAIREFFGSLMGMKNQLAEYSDGEEGGDHPREGDRLDGYSQDGEVEALRLFRS